MRISIITQVLALILPLAAAADPLQLDAIRQQADGGNPRQALQRLNTYLDQQPRDLDGLLLKGNLLVAVNGRDRAERFYQRLVREFPNQPEPFNNLAVLYAAEGRYEDAAEILQKALATHPSYRAAYENLGKVYGKFASQAYTEALGVKPPEDEESMQLVVLARSQPSPRLPSMSDQASDQQASLSRANAETSRSDRSKPGPLPTKPSPSRLRDKDRAPARASTQPEAEGRDAAETRQQRSAPNGVAAETAPSPAAKLPTNAEAVDETEKEPPSNTITQMVRAWARAWSEQRVPAYLAFYSESFRPESGISRAAWADQRRQRVQHPTSIRVVVNEFAPPVLREQTASITFTQIYTSDSFSDTMRKNLVLGWEDGTWRILAERKQP